MPGRLLLVAYTFPPAAQSGALRALRLARGLGRHGWEVTVLTADAAHYFIRDEALLERMPPEVRIVRVDDPLPVRRLPLAGTGGAETAPARGGLLGHLPAPVALLARKAKRAALSPDEQVLWARRAAAEARRLHAAAPFDAVLVTSPYHSAQAVGETLAGAGVPYVADFRDPWTLNPLYAERFAATRALERRMERRCLAAARAVVYTNEVVRERVVETFSDLGLAAKARVVENAYDEEDFDRSTRPLARTFLLVHAGNLYAARDPRPFLEGIGAFLAARPDARSVARVEFLGVAEGDLAGEIRRAGLEAIVSFRGFVPHAEALVRLCEAAVLVLITGLAAETDLFVPGKVYEYLGAGRPILAMVPAESATGRLLASRPQAAVVGVADPAAAGRALAGVFDRWRADAASIAAAPDPFCRAEATTAAYAAILDEVRGRR